MTDPATRELQARVALLERQVARYERTRRRGRSLPLAVVALLVALAPLAVLAATPFNNLTGGVHDANIDAIDQAGVTKGCVPDMSYCPTANVTREEMASFLARLGGLGSNPPVANAKTAQTATDAGAVGSYAPNGLVRAAAATQPERFEVPPGTPLTVTLAAPGPGLLLVSGAVIATTDGGGTSLVLRLRDPLSGEASPLAWSGLSGPTSLGLVATVPLTHVFPVTAGTRAGVLEAAKGGAGTTNVIDGQLTALFAPFGPAGGSTLAAP